MAASHAMISTWDDHEVMNNYAGADITNAGGGGDSKRTNLPLYTGWSDTAVATEFAAGSVTQLSNAEISALLGRSGYGTLNNVTLPAGAREPDYLSRNSHLKEFDQLHHGYVLASASATEFTATFKKLQTVRAKSTALASSKTYKVAANSTTIS